MYYVNYGNTAKKNAIAKIILTYFVRRNAEIRSITPGSIYITRDLQLSHYNETNFTNEINLLQSTKHGRERGRSCGRGRDCGREFRGHGEGFGRN